MPEPSQGLLPSVIDRLIDPESEGTTSRFGYDVTQMTHAVRRDLEDLLNTRQTNAGIPEAFVEVHRSILGYGLPDFASVNASTPEERDRIGRVIETVIARYEPRLRDVRVRVLDTDVVSERTVRFQVEARLAVDPAPEVEFETVLELLSGRTSVESRVV
jgi:type VI secretion system protein ImpF